MKTYKHEWIDEIDPDWGYTHDHICKHCRKVSARNSYKPRTECVVRLRVALNEAEAKIELLTKTLKYEILINN